MPGDLILIRRMTGPFHLNTYVLGCARTGQALVIDPGGQAADLGAFIRKEGLAPAGLLMTHGHADPRFSALEFKAQWEVPYCLHREDVRFFSDPAVQAATRRAVGLPPPFEADQALVDGQKIPFGHQEIQVIHTPGHTPGSCCFICQDQLFSGDTLFVGEAGRTDLPGGDLDRMIQSIQDRILPLPSTTHIHPGHHHASTGKSTTLAREIRENIYIRDFILDP